MRLTPDQVKQGILNPSLLVRSMALRYFSESFSTDPTVMPCAVQALQRHGWDQAFEPVWEVGKLVQTEETLLWFIDELNRLGRPKAQEDVTLCRRLSAVLSNADVALLMKHEARITGIEGLAPKNSEAIAERLRLLTVDPDACWSELEVLCDELTGRQRVARADIHRANRIVEAIARGGDAYANRVLSILSQTEPTRENDPMEWMECFVARLAGELRLLAAAPLLVAKLKADSSDLMNEQCQRAFIKIGTDSAVESICKDWSSAPWHYKLYASSSLERIYSDLVVSRCLDLQGHEAKSDIRSNLLGAVLNNFSSEGIEPARQSVRRKSADIRRELVTAATLMGASFPELEDWMGEEQTLAAKRMKRNLELAEMPEPPLAPRPKQKSPSLGHLTQPSAQLPLARQAKVGRNDPCPCGSGKKFKKCCMGKE